MKYKPDFILIDRLVEHLPATHSIVEKFKGVDRTVIEDIGAIKKPSDFSAAKKMLLITAHRGNAFKPCQGIGHDHLCCNYWIIDLISNCPMDCSYCILQHYLENNPFLTIYTNVEEILTRAAIYTAEHSDKKFRIGTGELSDSLALDDITGYSKKMMEFFSHHPNVTLEFKTKTTNLDHLLKIKDHGNAVISWSVNPQCIVEQEEFGAATLSERFNAAKTAIEAGYKIGFHFDPIILIEDWETKYKAVVDEIVQTFPFEKIAWISIGSLRFPTQMKEIVLNRFPKSRIFYNELVPINGKVRYFRPIRETIYRRMLEWFEPLRKITPVYLCMETKMVWENVLPNFEASSPAIEKHVCSGFNIQSKSF